MKSHAKRSGQKWGEQALRLPRRFDGVASPADRLQVFSCVHLLSGPAQPLCLGLRDNVIDLLRARHRTELEAWLAQARIALHDPLSNLLPRIVIATRLGRASPRMIPATGFGLVLIAKTRGRARQGIAASMATRLVRALRHYQPVPDAAPPFRCTSPQNTQGITPSNLLHQKIRMESLTRDSIQREITTEVHLHPRLSASFSESRAYLVGPFCVCHRHRCRHRVIRPYCNVRDRRAC